MIELYKCSSSSVKWNPSPIVALATSVDESQVTAVREDGSLEIWLVSPGAVGWHSQLTIQGNPNLRVSSLVWCCSCFGNELIDDMLFSSSFDGSVLEWDLFNLTQKVVVDPIGVSIWQMAAQPLRKRDLASTKNTHETDKIIGDGDVTSDSEVEADSLELYEEQITDDASLAIACDDGCARIYSILDSDGFTYQKSLQRISGRVLSVTWSPDAKMIYSGSSDGFIRCWDAKLSREVCRITVGLGGLGSDGQVILYKLSGNIVGSTGDISSSKQIKKWVYVGYVRAHTHDVRALTVVVPVNQEDMLPEYKVKRARGRVKPLDFSYNKWAHMGNSMLISAGDD